MLVAAVVVPLKIALYTWLPIPGMILRVAFPATSCAFPKIAVSSHKAADALQKVTVPADGAGLTEAVRVTSAGDATSYEESASVVVVGGGVACAAATLQATVNRADRTGRRLWLDGDAIRLQAKRDTFHI